MWAGTRMQSLRAAMKTGATPWRHPATPLPKLDTRAMLAVLEETDMMINAVIHSTTQLLVEAGAFTIKVCRRPHESYPMQVLPWTTVLGVTKFYAGKTGCRLQDLRLICHFVKGRTPSTCPP